MHWARGGGEQELTDAGIDPGELFAGTSALMADVAPRTERLVDWFLQRSALAHE
jgi:hypothetical protein